MGRGDRQPERTCVGCRTPRPANELIRVARQVDGNLAYGRTLAGRGAWLCADRPECLDLAIQRGGFNRAFRTRLTPRQVEGLRPPAP